MSGHRSGALRSLELYRSSVDAASHDVSEAVVSGAYNSALGALMHLLNFADAWYRSQNEEGVESDAIAANTNLRVADERLSMLIHLLLSRRICDLTGKIIALNVQRRLMTRDSILTKVLTNRKISDKSAALMFRLENVTAAFSGGTDEAGASSQQRPEGFPEGVPDSLAIIDTSQSGGYADLVGVEQEVRDLQRQIRASLVAKTSTMVLLHGPPGTGKTSLIVAAAKENGLPVATVTASNLGGEFIGEREQNTSDLFDYLEKVETDFVLFIDEADSFLPEAFENNTQSRLTRVLTINRMLRLVSRNDGVTRLVALASNYSERIARDVAESSFKLYLAPPSTDEQMRGLVSYYRRRAGMNMTRTQTDYVVRVALALDFAPGHVSLLMQRLLTNCLIKLLNNRVELQDVRADMFEQPVYMIEQDKRFEDGRAEVTLARPTDVPRSESDDSAAVQWERGNPIAFPVPDLNVDFESVLSQRVGVRLPPPPSVEFDPTFSVGHGAVSNAPYQGGVAASEGRGESSAPVYSGSVPHDLQLGDDSSTQRMLDGLAVVSPKSVAGLLFQTGKLNHESLDDWFNSLPE